MTSPTEYTVTDSGCWEWSGVRSTGGYGVARRDRRQILAHRLVYEREVGPIPEGLELDHLCKNTCCVNPEHLEPVTHAENIRRGRHVKLNHEIARLIRESDEPGTVLAERYGVATAHICLIRQGKRWAA